MAEHARVPARLPIDTQTFAEAAGEHCCPGRALTAAASRPSPGRGLRSPSRPPNSTSLVEKRVRFSESGSTAPAVYRDEVTEPAFACDSDERAPAIPSRCRGGRASARETLRRPATLLRVTAREGGLEREPPEAPARSMTVTPKRSIVTNPAPAASAVFRLRVDADCARHCISERPVTRSVYPAYLRGRRRASDTARRQ